VAVDLALRYPDKVRSLVLLEGDALGLSPAGLEWTKGLDARMRAVAARDGVDAVYPAVIDDVMGEGVWDSFPEEIRRVLTETAPRSWRSSATSTSRCRTPPPSPRSRCLPFWSRPPIHRPRSAI
jgi:pimeloyl-ACP methyl ester carboxylesterase